MAVNGAKPKRNKRIRISVRSFTGAGFRPAADASYHSIESGIEQEATQDGRLALDKPPSLYLRVALWLIQCGDDMKGNNLKWLVRRTAL
jgi:hypothetical protein